MSDSTRKSASISPTAHYTGQVWLRSGLSDERLRTPEGSVLFHVVEPLMIASRAVGGPTLEDFLLARHEVIALRLTEAIEGNRISQVIEIAAGLSPRGLRFTKKYGDRITYVEADLPEMAARKRALLGVTTPGHRVVTIDALADVGPDSLATLAKSLDRTRGVAVVTEGLLNYFDRDAVLGMWERFARALSHFPHGLYLADIHIRGVNRGISTGAFMALLSTFVRSRVHLHFTTEAEVAGELIARGFAAAAAIDPRALGDRLASCQRRWAGLVRVIEATTGD